MSTRLNCEHCSCFRVKHKRCCYCHEGGDESRRLDEFLKRSIMKEADKKEKKDE
jgi:hypothetical protein